MLNKDLIKSCDDDFAGWDDSHLNDNLSVIIDVLSILKIFLCNRLASWG